MVNKKLYLLWVLVALIVSACGASQAAPPEPEPEPKSIQAEPVETEEGSMVAEETPTEEAEATDGETLYVVSAAESSLKWSGEKVIGSEHYGSMQILEGALVVENGTLVSGTVVMDMTTIKVEDGAPQRLENHLKNDDFFSVSAHPTSTLEIISSEALGNDQYAVSATLTIKGISQPLDFVATVTEEGGRVDASAEIVFDRTLYDIEYKSASIFSGLGDQAIIDEVSISVTLVASKK